MFMEHMEIVFKLILSGLRNEIPNIFEVENNEIKIILDNNITASIILKKC